MKNKKIIALICALTVASVGIGVLASQAEPISDAYAAEQEEQTEELSETSESEVVVTDETVVEEIEETAESVDETVETVESVEETAETEAVEETEETEETEAESELGSVTICFVDIEGDTIADNIVILSEDELDEGLALYEETIDTLEADDYVLVSDEVASFDGDSLFAENDVIYSVTFRKELVFDVESATVNGIYVPNIIFVDDGHTAVYYLDDGTEIASLNDYDLPMTVECWRCRGIDKYYDTYCGGLAEQDDATLDQILTAYDMILNG